MNHSFCKNSGRLIRVAFVGLVAAAYVSLLAIGGLTSSLLGREAGKMALVSYDSPLVLGAAISILLRSTEWHVPKTASGVVRALSAGSFTVYVVHCAPAFYDGLLAGGLSWLAGLGPVTLAAACLLSSMAMYAIGLVCHLAFGWLAKTVSLDRLLASLGGRIPRILG